MNRFLIISFLFFGIATISYGQKQEPEKKGIILNRIPEKPIGWTNDYEHIFTAAQIDTLDYLLSIFNSETSNEVAIVTIDSNWSTKEKFDSLIIAIHNYWRVGEKTKNNGILIGISVKLRSIRISNGYGIEKKLSNSETKKIIDNVIIPYFKESNYFEGVRQGLLTIFQKIQ
ncbi:TPM domain-containing protein [Ferruginibacter albus]|uniref:TPM domain-containing protein n=1 Tax=Ferruginibacter albus TaxID=2875540 RepID=UPI001CC43E9D|nr:TPM domain-containing protein [Ferruginibacter albus]UAY50898.1 TPM domain-containing protein [Ferruginibacter albus]